MADNDTIADIIAEMRRGTRLPGYWHSCDVNKILQYHADRLEAAHRRERGSNRRPCKLKWIEDVVHQCIYPYHNIPVFVKQIDIDGKCERDIMKFPKYLQIRQVPWATKEAR